MDARHHRNPGPRATRKRAQTVPRPHVIAMTAAYSRREPSRPSGINESNRPRYLRTESEPVAQQRDPTPCRPRRVDQGRHPPRAAHAVPPDRGNLSKAGWVRVQGCPRHGCRGQAPMDGFTASPATGPTPPSHGMHAVASAVASEVAGQRPALPAGAGCNPAANPIPQSGSWVVCLIRCIGISVLVFCTPAIRFRCCIWNCR